MSNFNQCQVSRQFALASNRGGCQILKRAANELRCQISAELRIKLRIAAAVKFHVGELQIELQKLDAAAIYIYISPFIIT